MKKCVAFLLVVMSFSAKAQWVTIPDSAFAALLQIKYPTCMNGNQMDTTCPAIVNEFWFLGASNFGIYSIEGVEYFDNLEGLSCADNHLTSLSRLPPRLTSLNCSGNQLTALPNLPATLMFLDCQGNNLTTLSALPNSIEDLRCDGNQLTSLAALPTGLKHSEFRNNRLTSLPALPNGLEDLWVESNNIASLPPLPATLTSLEVNYNPLTTLPALPASLKTLLCAGINFNNTFPPLNNGLERLAADNSTFATFPALPSSLKWLHCWYCQLTVLPTLPNSLVDLNVHGNNLTSLPTLPSNLILLNCSYNDLTSLPALPPTLTNLWCTNNLLTALPPMPAVMNNLHVNDNQLTSIASFGDSMYQAVLNNNPNLRCLPPLTDIRSLQFTNTAVTCLPNYGTVAGSNPPLNTLPLCDVFNTNGCQPYWNISGKVYNDTSGNCTQDAAETNIINMKVNLYENGALAQQTHSGGYGLYSFDTDTGAFTMTIDTAGVPFDIICPAGRFDTAVLITSDSFDTDHDFAMQCKPGFDLGAWSVGSVQAFFPARLTSVWVHAGDWAEFWYQNCNTAGLSGQLTTIITGPVSYSAPGAGALTPSVSGDTLIYNISDWQAVNPNTDFNIIVQTDTFAQSGQQACVTVSVTSTGNDRNPSNDTYTHCFIVSNSYDPNDKQVSPIGDIDTTQEWLTYTVRFQNTGTAAAQHIYIDDTLDTDLDESTFQLLSYSHQPLTQLTQNAVRFNFPNINLADSLSDEPGSHGYVQYKVKLKDSLAIGTVIENTAAIYFDFNAPVITNTVTNTITLITVPPCFTTTITTNDSDNVICAGDSITLTAVNDATSGFYQWSNGDSTRSITVSYTTGGTYSYWVNTVDTFGCMSTGSVNIVVVAVPAAITPAQTIICSGDSLILAASGGVSYQWAHGGTDSVILVKPTATTVYTVTVTNSQGCTATASATVSVGQFATVTRPHVICAGDSLFVGGDWQKIPGLYMDTFLTTAGCDSVIGTQLIVQNNSASSISQTICPADSYHFNGQTLTAGGIYRDTLISANGCDSVITLTLTVTPGPVSSFSQSICAGDSYSFNNQLLTTAGTYYDTIPLAGGCDSIITLQLAVTNALTGSLSATICNSDSFFFNNQYQNTAGIYIDTLTTGTGCDSIVTLTLAVISGSSGVFNESICLGESYTFNNQVLTTWGTYYDTLVSSNGCDSLLALELTVLTPATNHVTAEICAGGNYLFNGENLTVSGSYYDTLTGAGGCDSVITMLALTVHPLPQAVVTQSDDTLSTGNFASYQWLQGITVINNATAQQLHVTQSGNYSVIVTDVNGCIDTSSLYQIFVGIEGLTNDDLRVMIYPNPNNGNFTLEFSDNKARELSITDMFGKAVLTELAVQGKKELALDEHAAGIYFVRIADGARLRTVKMIVLQ